MLSFSLMAYGANLLIPYNYMFLMSHDGTPYSILWDLLGGHPVLYPVCVVALFAVYLVLFFLVFNLIKKKDVAVEPSVEVEAEPLQEAAATETSE